MRQKRTFRNRFPRWQSLLKISCLLVFALTVALAGTTTALADRFPRDPVEDLRQVLKQERDPKTKEALDFRLDILRKRVLELRTIGDLSRALLLQEWRDEGLDPNVARIDRTVRSEVAKSFEDAVRGVLERGTSTTRLAVTNLVAEMAVTSRNIGTRSGFVREVIGRLAPDLTKLTTKDQDPRLREAAARALGLIQADPVKTAEVLKQVLAQASTAQRRQAAEALGSLMRVASQSEKKTRSETGSENLRNEVLTTGQVVVEAAGASLQDPDPEVRRLSVIAIQQAAIALADLVSNPAPIDFPPPEREPTEDEKMRIMAYSQLVHAEMVELKPLIDALIGKIEALARASNDPAVAVRVMARLTLEKLGDARQRLLRRQNSVPVAARTANPFEDLFKEGFIKGHAVQALAAGLIDSAVQARLAAIDALEMLTDEARGAAPALVRALSDPSLFVRWAAVRALGKMGPVESETAVPAFARLLTDPDLDLRLAAATALEQYGPEAKAAVPTVASLLGRGDVEIRVALLRVLEAIGTDAQFAVPAIAADLGDREPRVRRTAAEVLGRFGPLAQGAVDALRRALDDSDAGVRKAASDALLSVAPILENK